MAVYKPGSVFADIRGSIGDITCSRNQGGAYVKARGGSPGVPSAPQTAIRAVVGLLATDWSGVLTAQQRDDWRAYAAQHPRPNRWGFNTLANGYTRFVSLNVRQTLISGFSVYRDAPTLPPMFPPIFTFTTNAGTNNVTIDIPPQGYTTIPYFCIVHAYWGRVVSAGVNYYSSPWSYAGILVYVPGFGWTQDPWVLNYAPGLAPGDRLFLKFIIQNQQFGNASTYYQAHADTT